jgi:hypothetical protein
MAGFLPINHQAKNDPNMTVKFISYKAQREAKRRLALRAERPS